MKRISTMKYNFIVNTKQNYKRMKKTLFYTTLLLAGIAFSSCDSMLNVTPKTDLTDDGFWKSEADLKGACNRLYDQFDEVGGHDTRGDDQLTGSDISTGAWTIPAESDDWSKPYRQIATANNIIEKGSKTAIEATIRSKYIAEAYFFRAYYYFQLVSKYGDVPLVLKTFKSTQDPDLQAGRTPREDVIQQCYKDLDFAAANLPKVSALSTTSEFDRRRVSRSSALGLEVRIGLHEGTMQKYHNLGSESQWKAHLQKSIDAYTLLKAEGHALYTTGGTGVAYQALFFDESNVTNKEIIFAKAYGPNGGKGTGYTNHTYTLQCEGSNAVTRKMIDMYLYADGLPIDKTTLRITPEPSFNTAFGYMKDGTTPAGTGDMGKRDPRLTMSFWRIGDPQDNATATVGDAKMGWITVGKGAFLPFGTMSTHPAGYAQKKMFGGNDRYGNASQASDYTDRIVIRWGEMLIAYAEALYELNGSITDAQLEETVNALRARVGFTMKLTNAFVTTNGLSMLNEIRRERTVELICENLRYSDLIRWKIAETELPQAMVGAKYVATDNGITVVDPARTARLTDTNGKVSADGDNQQYTTSEPSLYVVQLKSIRKFNAAKDYFYPIPSFDIAQSGGNIKQNPNW